MQWEQLYYSQQGRENSSYLPSRVNLAVPAGSLHHLLPYVTPEVARGKLTPTWKQPHSQGTQCTLYTVWQGRSRLQPLSPLLGFPGAPPPPLLVSSPPCWPQKFLNPCLSWRVWQETRDSRLKHQDPHWKEVSWCARTYTGSPSLPGLHRHNPTCSGKALEAWL
jgi:hypothetical protein